MSRGYVMGRPRLNPGPVKEGQLECRHNYRDPDTDRIVVCAAPVPAGELTYLALNSRSGSLLALCAEHRAELNEFYEVWGTAAVGQATLNGTLAELADGRLVNHLDLKKALIERGELASAKGPLKPEDERRAIGYMFGDEARPAPED